ncbi:hypothetical protein GVT67_18020 [Salmonella enterica]|nr:hypothetical protein [Salmonella enterica]
MSRSLLNQWIAVLPILHLEVYWVYIQPSPDPAPASGVITLHLPGGCRIDCLPAQLPDVLKAVKHAEA